jgi:hypothetical protein
MRKIRSNTGSVNNIVQRQFIDERGGLKQEGERLNVD